MPHSRGGGTWHDRHVHPSTALATVIVDELVRGGVREAVIAPGSRSAPLAYALEAADRAGRLRLHVRVDERSAGFLALGMARATGAPVPMVTTSGTAVANLHPAVLEAHHGGVPLLVLSADRPAELRGTGANQTTVQPGIFAAAVRWEADLPAPESITSAAVAHWRSTVCRALSASLGRTDTFGGGPSHLNLSFRDPLAPDLADADQTPDLLVAGVLAGRADGGPWTVAEALPGVAGMPLERDGEFELDERDGRPETGGQLARDGRREAHGLRRTLVLLGDLPHTDLTRQALRWAAEAGWPVLAEPFGALPVGETVVPHGVLLAGRLAQAGPDDELHARLAPDRVVVVGRLTLFRELGALLRRPGVVVEQVSPTAAWTDPSHVVRRVHGAGVLAVPPARAEGWRDWVQAWTGAGRALSPGVRKATQGLTGPAVAACVAASLREEDVLVLGSSNAPRDLALAHDGSGAAARVIASRGLAGIDGTVSTAVGVALASPGRTVALMGDLTFLHDTNGLLVGVGEPRPDLTIVVMDDDGGGIFATLEYGDPDRSATPEAATATERLFGTPHGTDLAALCAAHGVAHTRIGSTEELREALLQVRDGIRVLVVPVPRQHHRALRDRLLDLVVASRDQ